MDNTINRCKTCGGLLEFDTKSQGLKCKYCENTISNLSASFNNVKTPYSAEKSQTKLAQRYYQLKCTSCNSLTELNGEDSPQCHSCGSTKLQITSTLNHVQNAIIPFTMSAEQCSAIFKKWIKKRLMAPSNLKRKAKINSLKPIYYPTFLFDANNSYSYSGIGVREYTDRKGHSHKTRKKISGSFVNYVIDEYQTATTTISSKTLKKLAPFNLQCAKLYDPKYIYGMFSNIDNMKISEGYNDLFNYIDSVNEKEAKHRHAEYDYFEHFVGNTVLTNVKSASCLVPIWTNIYTYNNKEYNCYINGNTGEITGKAPVSIVKVIILSIFILGLFVLLAYLFKK